MYNNGHCSSCPIEKECHYPFKPTNCCAQRKFWSAEQRKAYDIKNRICLGDKLGMEAEISND